jgi:pimeloyl-ACP methyl ester carboxylesterase
MAVELTPAVREQTRARYPEESGYVERDGVRVWWELYGQGERTVFLLPTWSVIHSRHWKAQIPYLARHFRVLVFDGRGNGRSDRPNGGEAYSRPQFTLDSLAVMKATATERAVLVGVSCSALWGLHLAAEHGERVAGAVFIAPAVPLAPPLPERAVHPFEDPLDTEDGWAKYNVHYWRREYEEFLTFFFGRCFTEPHSTKQIEDCVGWGLETTPDTLADTVRGLGLGPADAVRELATRVRCPVLVVHGDEDAIRPHAQGAALAELTGATFVTFEGSGHLPHARDPVKVNELVREFAERCR